MDKKTNTARYSIYTEDADTDPECYEEVDDPELIIRRKGSDRMLILGRVVEDGAVVLERDEHFEWSGLSMSLQEFVNEYQDSLPKVLRVVRTYDNRDNIDHAEEVYWIQGIGSQLRVLVTDASGQYFSITVPALSMFQKQISGDLLPQTLSLESALTKHDPMDKIQLTDVDPDVDGYSCELETHGDHLGEVQVKDVYQQRYLIANHVEHNKVSPDAGVIPLYRSGRVEPALGLTDNTLTATRLFFSSINYILNKSEKVKDIFVPGVELFGGQPEGDYDSIEPIAVLDCPCQLFIDKSQSAIVSLDDEPLEWRPQSQLSDLCSQCSFNILRETEKESDCSSGSYEEVSSNELFLLSRSTARKKGSSTEAGALRLIGDTLDGDTSSNGFQQHSNRDTTDSSADNTQIHILRRHRVVTQVRSFAPSFILRRSSYKLAVTLNPVQLPELP